MNGKVVYSHVIGFIAFCCVFVLLQFMAMMSMHQAARADLNPGVITTIWSIHPLFQAFLEYLVFGTKLEFFYIYGMLCIFVCSVLIGLSDIIYGREVIATDHSSLFSHLPAWNPVMFGLLTPISFAINGVLSKWLTQDRVGFNASMLTVNSYLLCNLVLVFIMLKYWIQVEFLWDMAGYALIGSVLDCVGMVLTTNAFSLGPTGPVSAIIIMSGMTLVIIEGAKNKKMISEVELVGCILGILGAFVIVIPDHVKKVFCFLCKKKKK